MNTDKLKRIYEKSFTSYRKFTKKLNEVLEESSDLLDRIFLLELELLETTYKYKKPLHGNAEEFFKQPVLHEIQSLQKFKQEKATSEYVLHISLICRTGEIFGWIDHTDTTDFVNGIMKYGKEQADLIKITYENEKVDIEWVDSWMEVLGDLSTFIIDNYSEGLTWHGTDTLPPPVILGDISSIYRIFDHLKLFKEINQGENIIKVLRQVKVNSPSAATLCEEFNGLEKVSSHYLPADSKWRIEHKKGDKNLLVEVQENADKAFIYNCKNCNVILENGVKVIRIDSCKNVNILLKSLEDVELVDCENINVHCFGRSPKISIDDSDVINVFISGRLSYSYLKR